MRNYRKNLFELRVLLFIFVLLTFACNLPNLQKTVPILTPEVVSTHTQIPAIEPVSTPSATIVSNYDEDQPIIPDIHYQINERLSYTVQSGDTLTALAARFHTSIDQILAENPFLSPAENTTTLMPGQVLSIKLVVEQFWDTGVLVIPNYLFINGPAARDFDLPAIISGTQGWLKDYMDNSTDNPVSGVEIVQNIVDNYSISPQVILTLLEYKLHALSDPAIPRSFSLGNLDPERRAFRQQLSWAVNILNNGYYGWRDGKLTQYTSFSGFTIHPNPWQNAASTALQYYFSVYSSANEYKLAIEQRDFSQTYHILFGPIGWNSDYDESLIPANLNQPAMRLPFKSGLRWALTAGPHSGWGKGYPWAAIDFAPPAETSGCTPSEYWAVAMADGMITRSEDGVVVQDLDGDGDSRTGWVIFYLHIHPNGAPEAGETLNVGERIGHPSCTGGQSTGRNLHIARLYNGEWIPAGGVIPFVMNGWVVTEGIMEYKGSLSRGSQEVYPSNVGVWSSQLTADD